MEQLKGTMQTQLSNTSGYTFLYIYLSLLKQTQAVVSKGTFVPQALVAMLSFGGSEAQALCVLCEVFRHRGAQGREGRQLQCSLGHFQSATGSRNALMWGLAQRDRT